MKGFNIYETKWGIGAVIFSQAGLAGVTFPQQNEVRLEETVIKKFGMCKYVKDLGKDLCSALERYFEGNKTHFDVWIDYGQATEFVRAVYETLRAIPYGEFLTYKELAKRSGNARAARAVGNALARNPVPIIVPCHRVLKSDGTIGGWSGMPGWKQRLLVLEGLPGKDSFFVSSRVGGC